MAQLELRPRRTHRGRGPVPAGRVRNARDGRASRLEPAQARSSCPPWARRPGAQPNDRPLVGRSDDVVAPARGSEARRRRGYVLKFDEAFSRLFLMESHAVSNPAFSCCPADSPAARISLSFLYAASRSTRKPLICSLYVARASALAFSPAALSASTSASHFFSCVSIFLK